MTRQQSTVEMAFEKMRRNIVDGRLAPGQRLVEADLTAEMGISRGPLREAIRRLASEGLVDIAHNKGAKVKRLDRQEVLALYEVREVMEGLAARLAAERGTAAERRAIAAIFDDMEKAISARNPQAYVTLNSEFHNQILAAARNEPLQSSIMRLQTPVLRHQFEALMTADVVQMSHDEHAQIAKAIMAQDGDDAEREMRRHIQRSRDLIADRPLEPFE